MDDELEKLTDENMPYIIGENANGETIIRCKKGTVVTFNMDIPEHEKYAKAFLFFIQNQKFILNEALKNSELL
ncbi:hypothetical protein M2T79_18590 [Elizabethkingia miricola]|uniref:hypothetical protein n=1 Tax=Elizabethkingia miricola TaxID=172045 RepID=UPI0020196F35|nr:hypothetical protein [Elizabethkingia miricola]MCL1658618.1 hypothetical protein [Elizabethkingia miricola]